VSSPAQAADPVTYEFTRGNAFFPSAAPPLLGAPPSRIGVKKFLEVGIDL